MTKALRFLKGNGMGRRLFIFSIVLFGVSIFLTSSSASRVMEEKIVPETKDLVINTPKEPTHGIVRVQNSDGSVLDCFQGRIKVWKKDGLYYVTVYSEEGEGETAKETY